MTEGVEPPLRFKERMIDTTKDNTGCAQGQGNDAFLDGPTPTAWAA